MPRRNPTASPSGGSARWLLLLSLFTVVFLGGAPAQHQHSLTEEELGTVHFPNSCSPQAQDVFRRAVALLHSFQYDASRAAFTEASEHDPNCAMARWGIAMSHYHGLWQNGDFSAGRVAFQQASAIASRNPATTAREKAYIATLAEVYKGGVDEPSRDRAFEKKLAALQAADPSDDEAAIFHALSLYVIAAPNDKTFANQRKCGEILEPIFKRQPHHPGVAHYLIHCYDNPALAPQALAAARMYAQIAAASAHANHMPSHIFTRLGLWDESVASNVKSAELAAASEPSSPDAEARDQRLHALDYLIYAYLQSGRVTEARAVLSQIQSLPPIKIRLTIVGDYALAAIPAREALELADWKEASALPVRKEAAPWIQSITWFAVGVGAARMGQIDRAQEAERSLAALRDQTRNANDLYWSSQIEVQRRQVAAWVQNSTAQPDAASDTMRSAADLEDSMDKDAITPGPVVPAREMLATLLQNQNRHAEALVAYETALKTAPNRFNAEYGAALCADVSGNSALANQHFKKLTEIAVGGERLELITARKKLAALASGQVK
jgi:tetratricopeptide (TPR) repeat protein